MFLKRAVQLIIVVGITTILVRMFVVDSFIVRGNSMAPALLDGDYVFINKAAYRFGEPKRADIVSVSGPEGPSQKFVKRAIALPGERIEIRNGRVFIKQNRTDDGIVLDEPYIATPTPIDTVLGLDRFEYFLMGDNRTASTDSRTLGAFSRRAIEGKLLFHISPKKILDRLKR